MDAALGWIGDLIRWVIRLLPHFVLLKSTHGGAKFRHGWSVSELRCDNGIWLPTHFLGRWRRSGLHCYLPFTTDVMIIPINRQTVNLPSQFLVTSDGRSFGASGIVVYEVKDPVAAIVETYDHDVTIRDYALAVIRKLISSHEANEITDAIDRECTRLLRHRLRRYGVRVLRVTLSDFIPCRAIGLFQAEKSAEK